MEDVQNLAGHADPRITERQGRAWSGLGIILALGTYVGMATLWLVHHYLRSDSPETVALAETVAFTGIILVEKANVPNFRSLRSPLISVGFFTNPWVLIAIVLAVGLQLCAVYVPFLQHALHTVPQGWSDWALIAAFAAPVFEVTEGIKWFRVDEQVQKPR